MASVAKLLAILANDRARAALPHGVAATMEHARALARFQFKTVIDVGANKGQFATFARSTWRDAKVICFEPLPGPRAKLTTVTAGHAQIFDCALGEVEQTAEIHISSREDSSSLLPLGDLQKSLYHMEETGTLKVPVRRLDDCVKASDIAHPALLKIDVQGFERDVLAGGPDVVDAVDAVYVEASFVELYKGQALAPEIIDLLHARGHRLVGVFNQSCDETGVPVQADLLFIGKAGRARQAD